MIPRIFLSLIVLIAAPTVVEHEVVCLFSLGYFLLFFLLLAIVVLLFVGHGEINLYSMKFVQTC